MQQQSEKDKGMHGMFSIGNNQDRGCHILNWVALEMFIYQGWFVNMVKDCVGFSGLHIKYWQSVNGGQPDTSLRQYISEIRFMTNVFSKWSYHIHGQGRSQRQQTKSGWMKKSQHLVIFMLSCSLIVERNFNIHQRVNI